MGLFTKDIKSMDDLFLHVLQDIYYAENQIIKALPDMIEKATNRELTAAFKAHLGETEKQVARLDQAFQLLGKEPKGTKCPAINGIIDEANEIAGEVEDKNVLDAALLAAAQAVEHYEITRYGTLIAWADELGNDAVGKLLTTNLNEEKAADKKLTTIAENKVNLQSGGLNMNASFEGTRSLWMSQEVGARPRLRGEMKCDTVIVGSGIAGLSVAYELAASDQKVIVLDRGPIAGGMTSRTTAHLAPICDDGVSELEKLRGEEIARLFQESQAAAVDRIEAIVGRHAISCNFRRLDAFLFPAMGMEPKDAKQQQDKEFEAVRKAGAKVERVRGVPLKGFESATVLRYPDQATFHPLKYINGLIAAIESMGGQLFQDSPVMEIKESDDGVTVVTDAGQVMAARAVFATNSPINDRVALHSKMAPYRTYAMAFTVPRGALPDALYWDMADPYHYVRLNPGPGTVDYLIAGGGDHKSGEADDGDVRFEAD